MKWMEVTSAKSVSLAVCLGEIMTRKKGFPIFEVLEACLDCQKSVLQQCKFLLTVSPYLCVIVKCDHLPSVSKFGRGIHDFFDVQESYMILLMFCSLSFLFFIY